MSLWERNASRRFQQNNESTQGRASAPPTARPMLFNSQRRTSTNGHGMAQLQQQRPETVQNNASHQRNVSITMAEVYNDLQILHQQQMEATRELENAKLFKQRKENALEILEQQLQDLKFSNGVCRSNVIRMRDLLASAQRLLAISQDKEKRARNNLQELEEIVRIAIDMKRSFAVDERHDDFLTEKITAASEIRRENATTWLDECQQLEAMFKDSERQFESIQAARQDKEQQGLECAQETLQVREEGLARENDIETSKQSRLQALHDIADLERQLAEEDETNRLAKESTDNVLASLEGAIVDTEELLRVKETDAHQANANLQENWEALVQVQRTEGHSTSPHPFVTNEPAVLDFARVAETVMAEAAAAAVEEAAKNERQVEVVILEKELLDCKSQLQEKVVKAAELNRTFDKQMEEETQRQQHWVPFLKAYESIKKEADHLRASMEEFREKRDEELQAALKRSLYAKEALKESQTAMDAAEHQLLFAKGVLETEELALADSKLDQEGMSLDELGTETVAIEESIHGLQAEKDRSETEDAPAVYKEELAGITLPETEIKVKSARYLKAYPALEDISFVYDPAKTFKRQKKECLFPIHVYCKKRLDSARKMARELMEASEREEAERAKVEQASKADRKRKEELRQKRTQGLESDNGDATERHKETVGSHENLEKILRHKEKLRVTKQSTTFITDADIISVAKPRDLYDSFSQADHDDDEDAQPLGHKKVHWDVLPSVDNERIAPSASLDFVSKPKSSNGGDKAAETEPSLEKNDAVAGRASRNDKHQTAKQLSAKLEKDSLGNHDATSTDKAEKDRKKSGTSSHQDILTQSGKDMAETDEFKAQLLSSNTDTARSNFDGRHEKHLSRPRDDVHMPKTNRNAKKHRSSSSSNVTSDVTKKLFNDSTDGEKKRSKSDQSSRPRSEQHSDQFAVVSKKRHSQSTDGQHRSGRKQREAKDDRNSKKEGSQAMAKVRASDSSKDNSKSLHNTTNGGIELTGKTKDTTKQRSQSSSGPRRNSNTQPDSKTKDRQRSSSADNAGKDTSRRGSSKEKYAGNSKDGKVIEKSKDGHASSRSKHPHDANSKSNDSGRMRHPSFDGRGYKDDFRHVSSKERDGSSGKNVRHSKDNVKGNKDASKTKLSSKGTTSSDSLSKKNKSTTEQTKSQSKNPSDRQEGKARSDKPSYLDKLNSKPSTLSSSVVLTKLPHESHATKKTLINAAKPESMTSTSATSATLPLRSALKKRHHDKIDDGRVQSTDKNSKERLNKAPRRSNVAPNVNGRRGGSWLDEEIQFGFNSRFK
ncbi:hypothetical protein MPSEU_000625500 [Mayamaea pseudoterrestris]|nr:hypothetical protein MPSEU_000625500 [Mayamaea pseudoterrestris]